MSESVTSQQTQALNQFFKETRDAFRQAVPEVDRWSNETLFDTLYHNYPEFLKDQGFQVDDYRPEIRSGAGLVEKIRKDSGLEDRSLNEVTGLIRKQLPSLARAWGLNDPDFDAEKSRTLEDRILLAFPYWIGRLPTDDTQISPELQKALKDYENSEDEGQEGFWHSLITGGGAAGWIPYVGDVKGAVDAVSLLRLASKAEDDPESLSDEETIRLNLMLAAALEDANKGWRAKAGDFTRDSIVFGLELLSFAALTGAAVATSETGVGAAGFGSAAAATGAAASATASKKVAAKGLRAALLKLAEKMGLRASRKAAVEAGNVGLRKWVSRLTPKAAEKFAAKAASISAGHPARVGRAYMDALRGAWLDTGMKMAYRSNFNAATGALKEGVKKTFLRQSFARGIQVAMADAPIALGMTAVNSAIKGAGSYAFGGQGKSKMEAQREVGEYLSGRPASEVLADRRLFRDLGSAMIENFSETLGEDLIGPAMGAVLRRIGGLKVGSGTVAKLADSAVRRYFDDAAEVLARNGADAARLGRLRRITGKMALFNQAHPIWAQTQGDLLRLMHYDGFLNEALEERAGDFMYGLIGWEGDGSPGDVGAALKNTVAIFDPENRDDLKAEFVSLAFPSTASLVRGMATRNIAAAFDSNGLRLLELMDRSRNRRTSPSADPRYSGVSSVLGEAPAKPADAAQGAIGMASDAGLTYLGKDDKRARAAEVGRAGEEAREKTMAELEEEASKTGGMITVEGGGRQAPLRNRAGRLTAEARRLINKAVTEAENNAGKEHDKAWDDKVQEANGKNAARRAELEAKRDEADAGEEDKGVRIQMLRRLAADELRQKQLESTSDGAFDWYGSQIDRVELGLEDAKLRETADRLSDEWDRLPEDRRRDLAARRKGVMSKEDRDAIVGTLAHYVKQLRRQSRSQGWLMDLANTGLQWATGLVWVNRANATDRTDGRGGFEAAADMALRRYGVAQFLTQASAYARALWDSEIDPAMRPVSEYEFSEAAETAHAALSDHRPLYENDKESAFTVLKDLVTDNGAGQKAAEQAQVSLKNVEDYKNAGEILDDIRKVDEALRTDPAAFGVPLTGDKTHVIPAEDYKTADGKEVRYNDVLAKMSSADAERFPKAAAFARTMEDYVARRAAEHVYENIVLPFMKVLSVTGNLTTDEISRLRTDGMDEAELAKRAETTVAELNKLLTEGKLDPFFGKDPKTGAIVLKDIELATGELRDEADALMRREILGRMGIHTAYRDATRLKEAEETLYRKPFAITYKVDSEKDTVLEKPRRVSDIQDQNERVSASRAPFAQDENEDLGTVARRINDTIRAIEQAKNNASGEEAALWDEALAEAKERRAAALYLLATSDYVGSGEWITADTVQNILSKGPRGLKVTRGDSAQVRLLKVMLGASRDNIDVGDPDVIAIANTLGVNLASDTGRAAFAMQAKFFADKLAKAMQEQPYSIGMVLHTEDDRQEVTGRFVVVDLVKDEETVKEKVGDREQDVVRTKVTGIRVVPLTDSGLRYPEDHPKGKKVIDVRKEDLGKYHQTPLQRIRFTRRALIVEGTRDDFLAAGFADLSTSVLENPTVRVNDSAGNIDTKRSRYRLRVNAVNSADGGSITFGLLYDQGADEDLLESMLKRTKAFQKVGAADEVKGVHLRPNPAYALPVAVKDALDEALALIRAIPPNERSKDQQAALDLLDVHSEEGKEVTAEEYARVERARFEVVGKVWMQSFGGYQAMPSAVLAEYMREARVLALTMRDPLSQDGKAKTITGTPTEYSHLANVMDFVYHSIVGQEYMEKLQYHAFGTPVPSAETAVGGRRAAAKAGSDEWAKRVFQLRKETLERDLARVKELADKLQGDTGALARAEKDLSDRKAEHAMTRDQVLASAASSLVNDIVTGKVKVDELSMPDERRAELSAEVEKWRKAVDEYEKKRTEARGEDGARTPSDKELADLNAAESRKDGVWAALNNLVRDLGEPLQQAVDKVLENNQELKQKLDRDSLEVVAAGLLVNAAHQTIDKAEEQIGEINQSISGYTDMVDMLLKRETPSNGSTYSNVEEAGAPGDDSQSVVVPKEEQTPANAGGTPTPVVVPKEEQTPANLVPGDNAQADDDQSEGVSQAKKAEEQFRELDRLLSASADAVFGSLPGSPGSGTSVESATAAPSSQDDQQKDPWLWLGVDIRKRADPEAARLPDSLKGRHVSLLSIVAATSDDKEFVRARADLDKLLRGGMSVARSLVATVELLADEMARFSRQTNDVDKKLLSWTELIRLRGSNDLELVEKNPDVVLPVRMFYAAKVAQALMEPQLMANLRVPGRLVKNEHLAAMIALYTFDRDFRAAYESNRVSEYVDDAASDEESPDSGADGDFDNEKRFAKLDSGLGGLVDNLQTALLEKNGGTAYRSALGQMARDVVGRYFGGGNFCLSSLRSSDPNVNPQSVIDKVWAEMVQSAEAAGRPAPTLNEAAAEANKRIERYYAQHSPLYNEQNWNEAVKAMRGMLAEGIRRDKDHRTLGEGEYGILKLMSAMSYASALALLPSWFSKEYTPVNSMVVRMTDEGRGYVLVPSSNGGVEISADGTWHRAGSAAGGEGGGIGGTVLRLFSDVVRNVRGAGRGANEAIAPKILGKLDQELEGKSDSERDAAIRERIAEISDALAHGRSVRYRLPHTDSLYHIDDRNKNGEGGWGELSSWKKTGGKESRYGNRTIEIGGVEAYDRAVSRLKEALFSLLTGQWGLFTRAADGKGSLVPVYPGLGDMSHKEFVRFVRDRLTPCSQWLTGQVTGLGLDENGLINALASEAVFPKNVAARLAFEQAARGVFRSGVGGADKSRVTQDAINSIMFMVYLRGGGRAVARAFNALAGSEERGAVNRLAEFYVTGIRDGLQSRLDPANESSATLSDCLRAYADLVRRSYCTFIPGENGAAGRWVPGDTLSPLASLTEEQLTEACTESDELKKALKAAADGKPLPLKASQLSSLLWEHDLKYMSGGNAAITGVNSLLYALRVFVGDRPSDDGSAPSLQALLNRAMISIPAPAAPADDTEAARAAHAAAVKDRSVRVADRLLKDSENALDDAADLNTRMFDDKTGERTGKSLLVRGHVLFRNYLTPTQIRQPGSSTISTLVYPAPYQTSLAPRLIAAGVVDEKTPFSTWQITGDLYKAAADSDASVQRMIQNLTMECQVRDGSPVLSIMLSMNDKDKQPPSANLKRGVVVNEMRSMGSVFDKFLASLEDIRAANQSPQSFIDAADAWDRMFPGEHRPKGAVRMSLLLRASATKTKAKGALKEKFKAITENGELTDDEQVRQLSAATNKVLEGSAAAIKKAIPEGRAEDMVDLVALAAANVVSVIGDVTEEPLGFSDTMEAVAYMLSHIYGETLAGPVKTTEAEISRFEKDRATTLQRVVTGNYAGLVLDALMEDAKKEPIYLVPSISVVPGLSEKEQSPVEYREVISVRQALTETREADGSPSRKLSYVLEIGQESVNGRNNSKPEPVNAYVTSCFMKAARSVLERNTFGPGSLFGQAVWNDVARDRVKMDKRARLLTTSFIPTAITDKTGASTFVLVLDKPNKEPGKGGLTLEIQGTDGTIESVSVDLSSDGSQIAGSEWSKIMRESMGGEYDGVKSITMSSYFVLKGNTVSLDGMDGVRGNAGVVPALDSVMNALAKRHGEIVSEIVDDGAAKVVNTDEGQWDRVDQLSEQFMMPDGRLARVRVRGRLVRRFNADTGRVANLQHDAREVKKKLFANYNESWGHMTEAQRAMARCAYTILNDLTDLILNNYYNVFRDSVDRVAEEVKGEPGPNGLLLRQGVSPDHPLVRTGMWTRIRSTLAKAMAPYTGMAPLQLLGARETDTDAGAPSTYLFVRNETDLPVDTSGIRGVVDGNGFRYTPAVIDANIAGARYAWRLNDSANEADAMEAVRAAAEAQYRLIRLENEAKLKGIQVPGTAAKTAEQVPENIRAARNDLAARMKDLDKYYTDFHDQLPSELCRLFGRFGVPLQDLLVERKTGDGTALSLDKTAFVLTNDGKQRAMLGSIGIDHRMPTGYAGTATVAVRVGLPVTTKTRSVRTVDAAGRNVTKSFVVPGTQNLAVLPHKLEQDQQGKDNDGDTDYVQLLTYDTQLGADAGTAEMARDDIKTLLDSVGEGENAESFDGRFRDASRRAMGAIVRMKLSSYRNLTPQEATLKIDKKLWLDIKPAIVDRNGSHPVIGAPSLGDLVKNITQSRGVLGYLTTASYILDMLRAAESKRSSAARAMAVTALDGISILALLMNEDPRAYDGLTSEFAENTRDMLERESGPDKASVFYSDMATLRVVFTTLANLAFDAVGDPVLQALNVPSEAVGLFQRFFTSPGRREKTRRLATEDDPRGMEKAMVAEWMAFVRRPEVRAYISMLVNGGNDRLFQGGRDSWNGILPRMDSIQVRPDSEFVQTREDPDRNIGSVVGVASTRRISQSAFARQLARQLSSSMGEGDIFNAPVERGREALKQAPTEGAMDGMDVAVAVARSVLDGSYYGVRRADAALDNIKTFLGKDFDLSLLDTSDGIELAMKQIQEGHDKKTDEYKTLSTALNAFFCKEAVPDLARTMSGGVDLSQITRFIKTVEKAEYDPKKIGGLINAWAAMREQDLRPWLASPLGQRSMKSLQRVVASMAEFFPSVKSLMLSSIFTADAVATVPYEIGVEDAQNTDPRELAAQKRMLRDATTLAYTAIPQPERGSETGVEGLLAHQDAWDSLYLVWRLAQKALGRSADDYTGYSPYIPLAANDDTAKNRLTKFARYVKALNSDRIRRVLPVDATNALTTLLAWRSNALDAVMSPNAIDSLLSQTKELRNEGVDTIVGNQNAWAKFPAWIRQLVPGAGIQDSLFRVAGRTTDIESLAAGYDESGFVPDFVGVDAAAVPGKREQEPTFAGVTVGAVGNSTGTQQQLISCLQTHEDRCLVVMALIRASDLLTKGANEDSVKNEVTGLLSTIPGVTSATIDEFVANTTRTFRGNNHSSDRASINDALYTIQVTHAHHIANVLGKEAGGKVSVQGVRRYVECALATIMLRSAGTETSASGHNYIQLFPVKFIEDLQSEYDEITGGSAADRLGISPTGEPGYPDEAAKAQRLGDLYNRFGISRVDQAPPIPDLDTAPKAPRVGETVPLDPAYFETGTGIPEVQVLRYALRDGTSGARTLPASKLPVITVNHLRSAEDASAGSRYANADEATRDAEENFASILVDHDQAPAAVLVWPGMAKQKYDNSPGFPPFHGIRGYGNALAAAVTGADRAAKAMQDAGPVDPEILQRALARKAAGHEVTDFLELDALAGAGNRGDAAKAAFEQGVGEMKAKLSGGASTSVGAASAPVGADESVDGPPRLTPKYVRAMAKRLAPELERNSTASDTDIPGASLMPVTTASDDYVRRSVFNILGVPESTQTSKLGAAGLEVVAPFLVQGRPSEELVRFGVIGAEVAAALESGQLGALDALDSPAAVTELVREFGEADGKQLARRIGQAVMNAREIGINAEHQVADPYVGYPAERVEVIPEGGVVRKALGSGLDHERDDSTSTSVSSMASVVAERIAWELSVGGPSLVHKYLKDASYFLVANSNLVNSTMDSLMHIFASDRSLTGLDLRDKEGNLKRNGIFSRWGALTTEGDRTIVRYTESERNLLSLVLMAIQAAATGQDYVFVQGANTPIRTPKGQPFAPVVEQNLASSIGEDGMPDGRAVPVKLITDTFDGSELRKKLEAAGRSKDELDIYKLADRLTDFVSAFRRRTEQFAGKFLAPEQLLGAVRADIPVAVSADGFRGVAWVDAAQKVSAMARRVGSVGVGEVEDFDLAVELNPTAAASREAATRKQLKLLKKLKDELLRMHVDEHNNVDPGVFEYVSDLMEPFQAMSRSSEDIGRMKSPRSSIRDANMAILRLAKYIETVKAVREGDSYSISKERADLIRTMKLLAREYDIDEVPAENLQMERFKDYREAFEHGRYASTANPFLDVSRYVKSVLDVVSRRLVLEIMMRTPDARGNLLLLAVPENGVESEDISAETFKFQLDYMTKRMGPADDAKQGKTGVQFDPEADPRELMRQIVDGDYDVFVPQIKQTQGVKYYEQVPSPYRSEKFFYASAYGKPFSGRSRGEYGETTNAVSLLKHVIGRNPQWYVNIGRRRFDVAKAALDLVRWTKHTAVGHSLFFMFAGLESVIAGTGLRRNILLRTLRHPFGKNNPWRQMAELSRAIKRGDPMYDQIMYDLHRAGLCLSDSVVTDLTSRDNARWVQNAKELGEAWGGKKWGQRFELGATLLSGRVQSDWMMGDFFPALKTWGAIELANEMSAKMPGVPRSEIYRIVSPIINSAYGGRNWHDLGWATPKAVYWMNMLLFAPQWTLAAWETAGGGMLTGHALGDYITPEQAKFVLRNWAAMYVFCLQLMPNLIQAAIYMAAGRRPPDDDDDPAKKDHWFAIMNERDRGGLFPSIDITPLMRSKFGKVLRLGREFDGGETGNRRVYVQFGKQSYEVLNGWFDNPKDQLLRKTSQPVKLVWEQLFGYSPGSSDFALPFAKSQSGFLGSILSSNKGFRGSRVSYIAQKFMPLTASQILNGQWDSAGVLIGVAPIKRGMSRRKAIDAVKPLLESYAAPGTYRTFGGVAPVKYRANRMFGDYVRALEENGYDARSIIDQAQREISAKYYQKFFEALEANNNAELEEAARSLIRLGVTANRAVSSYSSKYRSAHGTAMTKEQRAAVKAAFDTATPRYVKNAQGKTSGKHQYPRIKK